MRSPRPPDRNIATDARPKCNHGRQTEMIATVARPRAERMAATTPPRLASEATAVASVGWGLVLCQHLILG